MPLPLYPPERNPVPNVEGWVGHRAGLEVSGRKNQIYSLFWDVTQRSYVVGYHRFETTYLSHLQGSSCRLRLLDWTGRLSRNVGSYLSTLRNIPEKQRSHLQRWKPESRKKKKSAAPAGIISPNRPVRNPDSTPTTLPHLPPLL